MRITTLPLLLSIGGVFACGDPEPDGPGAAKSPTPGNPAERTPDGVGAQGTGAAGQTAPDAGAAPDAAALPGDAPPVRVTQPLMEGWSFTRDELTTDAALAATGKGWEAVTLPHTWNAHDAANLQATDYARGVGWYRLELEAPASGARHFLEFGAASLVADVWLNGEHLGQHGGGFTQFRFDVTDLLLAGGPNVLLVRADNTEPEDDDDLTAIAPLGGDFNVSGGLYRHVALISTASAAHFELEDFGGPGVYAATTSVSAETALVSVRARLRNNAAAASELAIRLSLVDATGQVSATFEQPLTLEAETSAEVTAELNVTSPHLWQGVADPYLYQLVAELVDAAGVTVDRVTEPFGIREMRFDAEKGFFLNGQHVPLHGVALHQDFLEKGWAVSDADIDTSLALVTEMGANAVRLGHYPFSDYTLDRLSELGLIAWAETPVGLRTALGRCSTSDATPRFVENAKQQLSELIRQQHNQAAVAFWAVGNESTAGQLGCDEPTDNVTPVIRELHELAKLEDPTRVTVYAEFAENIGRPLPFSMGGVTDVLATNRYYYWYDLAVEEYEPLLRLMRERFPEQPLGISEYGAGAALTHHSDNPLGGPPEVRSGDEGDVAYQPEEYASYAHEQNYRVISSLPFLWGSFAWNMFDFGSARRNEGDVLGVNTKGLVTFDRQTRKDPFFFYKANWSAEPVTYITSRRYTDRAYAVTDVKVYSNADSVALSVNDTAIAELSRAECAQSTCVFEDVPLSPGLNRVIATGVHGGELVMDNVEWSLNTNEVNIAAGRLATGYVTSEQRRFGSDNFFSGGAGGSIDPGDVDGGTPAVDATKDPQLYKFFREGKFSYDIPLPNGSYELVLGFIEPDEDLEEGDRVFDVTANGETLLEGFDILEVADEPREAVTRRFTTNITEGHLQLDFRAEQGDAVVSNIALAPLGAGQQ